MHYIWLKVTDADAGGEFHRETDSTRKTARARCSEHRLKQLDPDGKMRMKVFAAFVVVVKDVVVIVFHVVDDTINLLMITMKTTMTMTIFTYSLPAS